MKEKYTNKIYTIVTFDGKNSVWMYKTKKQKTVSIIYVKSVAVLRAYKILGCAVYKSEFHCYY